MPIFYGDNFESINILNKLNLMFMLNYQYLAVGHMKPLQRSYALEWYAKSIPKSTDTVKQMSVNLIKIQ